MEAKRILIVDDNSTFRQEVRQVLERLRGRFEIVGEAGSGEEAVLAAARLRPHAILMDHNLPGISGVTATRFILTHQPHIPIIFLASEDTWRSEALDAGASAYLLKEEVADRLAPTLRSALDLPAKARLAGLRTLRWPALALATIALILLSSLTFVATYGMALLGLLFGFLFFIYALKYYGGVALVLGSNGSNGSHGLNGRIPAVRLKEEPFISIHLPLYNEPEVVDRLLTACTTLDYENYEVLVADDSTDETMQVLERWAQHPRVRVLHRSNRRGFKGGALQNALECMDPRTQFVVVFDADFVPPSDILQQFLAYFYGTNGDVAYDEQGPVLSDPHVAVVQGYQWHMLNAGENWITRGIRAEFSGSYVIERPVQEFIGSMKMISGSVFMIRADILRQLGWGTSITEDWELTLRLYLEGLKILYTPYIQAPAECVSTFQRLTRQRMRWAEGHTFNVKNYFTRILRSPKLSLAEKLEFIYYAPYYLQSVFFIAGTAAWFFSELVFHQYIPYWTSLLGWSLVFTNALALILMNLSGLFLEKGVRRNWSGILSFILLTYLLVPYQGYAALKGLLEKDEGGWHRTPKSGRITEAIGKLRFGKKFGWLLPRGPRRKPAPVPGLAASAYPHGRGTLTLWPIRLMSRRQSQRPRLAQAVAAMMAATLMTLFGMSVFVPTAVGNPDSLYFHPSAPPGSPAPSSGRWMNTNGAAETGAVDKLLLNASNPERSWYTEIYPTGNDDGGIAAGTTRVILYFPGTNGDFTFYVTLSSCNADGTSCQVLGQSANQTLTSSSTSPMTISFSTNGATFSASNPQRLRLGFHYLSGPDLEIRYDNSAQMSRVDTPVITVPEASLAFLPLALAIPFLASRLGRGRRALFQGRRVR